MRGENFTILVPLAFFSLFLAIIVSIVTISFLQHNISTQPFGWSIVVIGMAVLSYLIYRQLRLYRRVVKEGDFEDQPVASLDNQVEGAGRKRQLNSHLAFAFVFIVSSIPFIAGIYLSLRANDLVGSIFFDIISIFLVLIAVRNFWKYKQETQYNRSQTK